jgi:hypothetical protein
MIRFDVVGPIPEKTFSLTWKQHDQPPCLRRMIPSKWLRTLRLTMPLRGGIHYHAAFRFSVLRDHAVIR